MHCKLSIVVSYIVGYHSCIRYKMLYPVFCYRENTETKKIFAAFYFLYLNENPRVVLLEVQYHIALTMPFHITTELYLCCEGINFFDRVFSQIIFP